MEEQVARHVAYERYDDGRLIGYQGRPPDRFYYIIAGRGEYLTYNKLSTQRWCPVHLLRQFKLTTGYVTKVMETLIKGTTSDVGSVRLILSTCVIRCFVHVVGRTRTAVDAWGQLCSQGQCRSSYDWQKGSSSISCDFNDNGMWWIPPQIFMYLQHTTVGPPVEFLRQEFLSKRYLTLKEELPIFIAGL
jgi:hypothetical protein